ncbi:MAG TPA: hypothetical protein VK369_06815 [Segetibacter sp.]|nr:hypothetical protein [Segetibacter sp.]
MFFILPALPERAMNTEYGSCGYQNAFVTIFACLAYAPIHLALTLPKEASLIPHDYLLNQ